MTVSCWILLRMRTVQIKDLEKFKIHILYPITFSGKSCCLWDNVEKFGGARGRRWQYGGSLLAGLVRLHARKHTTVHPPINPRPCTHARTHTQKYVILIDFSMARVVSWMRVSVTLYVHCLSCSNELCSMLLICSVWKRLCSKQNQLSYFLFQNSMSWNLWSGITHVHIEMVVFMLQGRTVLFPAADWPVKDDSSCPVCSEFSESRWGEAQHCTWNCHAWTNHNTRHSGRDSSHWSGNTLRWECCSVSQVIVFQ